MLTGTNSGTDAVVMVGDVSGKGVAAALLMSHLHAIFRATAGAGLAEMVERANRLLCAAAPAASFATLVAARLRPDGMIELCTAGHTPPLVVTADGIRQLPSDGMPLGLFCEAPYSTRELHLEPGGRCCSPPTGSPRALTATTSSSAPTALAPRSRRQAGGQPPTWSARQTMPLARTAAVRPPTTTSPYWRCAASRATEASRPGCARPVATAGARPAAAAGLQAPPGPPQNPTRAPPGRARRRNRVQC